MVDIIRQTNLRIQHGCFRCTEEGQVDGDGGLSMFSSLIFSYPWFLISEILHSWDEFVLSIFRLKFQRLELFLFDLSLSVHTENFMRT